MFEKFKAELLQAFTQPLPGKEAHELLKPYLKINKNLDAPRLPNAKSGAVISLIYPIDSIPHILFIERPVYDGVHIGQIAFLGGKIEKEDASVLDAALRETWEEIGVEISQIRVAGPLPEVYVLASNFIVYPFVGLLDELPALTLDQKEVADTLAIPLYRFFEPTVIKEKPMRNALGFNLMAPYYDLDGKVLWGATAMMVSELCDIIRKHQIALR